MEPPPLLLPAVQAATIRHAWHEARAASAEPCGYLLGEDLGDDGLLVHEVRIGRNVHPEPSHAFALAPEEHLAVRRDARVRDWRVLGCWHGHLEGDARPSRADAQGLGPLGPSLVLIAGRPKAGEQDDPPWLRAWRRVEGDAPDGAWIEVGIVSS